MAVITEHIQLSTEGNADIIDITPEVNQKLDSLKIKNGIVNISVCGSTGALTTCEYEPGLIQDLKDIFHKLIPGGIIITTGRGVMGTAILICGHPLLGRR